MDSEDALQISLHKLESYLQIWTKNFNKQNENSGFERKGHSEK